MKGMAGEGEDGMSAEWRAGPCGGMTRARRPAFRISGACTVLALVMAPHLAGALTQSHLQRQHAIPLEAAPAKMGRLSSRQPELMRLRGGAFIDKRTPTYWPMLPEDEIPEDGSVGGHYTMEEVCARGGGQWIGKPSPPTSRT